MPAPATILWPDARLREPAAPVGDIDATARADASRLVMALRSLPAIGLAGPHLGIMRRIVALDPAAAGGVGAAQAYLDPRITFTSPETASHEEGSVSLPGITETVTRPARIRMAWRTLAGEEREAEFDGFLAACLQHEVDQCDGIFWLERVSRLKRERALARFAKRARRES